MEASGQNYPNPDHFNPRKKGGGGIVRFEYAAGWAPEQAWSVLWKR